MKILIIHLLEEIAAYFREARKKYAKFEGSLKGVDSRILVAQVPGGMLTNFVTIRKAVRNFLRNTVSRPFSNFSPLRS